tara:strand:+ start:19185 stop:19721 length:537 start_codon:yes stop_codon:yes gene_type:complete
MRTDFHILGISGSLRKESSNTAILSTVADKLPKNITLEIASLDLPLYNEDIDHEESPESVNELRRKVSQCHALLIASPEYNHGVSGVLKNALDWLSRPHGRSVLAGKPTLTFSASPAFTGGVRSHQQLNETLQAVQANQISYPQIVIAGVTGKISNGKLVDEAALSFLLAGVDQLVKK